MQAVFAVGIVCLFAYWVGHLKREIAILEAHGGGAVPAGGGGALRSPPAVHKIDTHAAPPPLQPKRRPAVREVAPVAPSSEPNPQIKRVAGTGIPTWTIE